MAPAFSTLRNIWEKNWPGVHAAAMGGLPQFIFTSRPSALCLNIPVFCYHVVNTEDFEADLEFLSRNSYVTIDADALLDHLEERCKAPNRALVLTIDDGARNLYDVAFPLLKRYGMKAVAFIATQFHREDSNDLANNLKSNLRHPLSWSQIREMHTSGFIDFQSHTFEHRSVQRWPETADLEGSDPEVVCSLLGAPLTIQEDFRLAKETLEKELNKTVRHLAFAKFNGTTEALRIGYALGYKAFWWGVLPHRPDNRPGQAPSHVVRLNGRYLRRLPGVGRESLARILRTRYRRSALRLWAHFRK